MAKKNYSTWRRWVVGIILAFFVILTTPTAVTLARGDAWTTVFLAFLLSIAPFFIMGVVAALVVAYIRGIKIPTIPGSTANKSVVMKSLGAGLFAIIFILVFFWAVGRLGGIFLYGKTFLTTSFIVVSMVTYLVQKDQEKIAKWLAIGWVAVALPIQGLRGMNAQFIDPDLQTPYTPPNSATKKVGATPDDGRHKFVTWELNTSKPRPSSIDGIRTLYVDKSGEYPLRLLPGEKVYLVFSQGNLVVNYRHHQSFILDLPGNTNPSSRLLVHPGHRLVFASDPNIPDPKLVLAGDEWRGYRNHIVENPNSSTLDMALLIRLD